MNTTDYAVCVALDWSDQQHAFALQFAAANSKETGMITASPEGFHGWLEALHARCPNQRGAVILEAGRNSVVHMLVEHPWLEIFPIHPATCARFRTAFTPSRAKDDVPDAEVLLTLLLRHRDQLHRLHRDSAQTRELAALVVARRHAVDRRTQIGHQLRTTLKSYFPQALQLIGEAFEHPMALDFLNRWPDLGSLKKARATTLRTFYYLHRARRTELIEQRIKLIAEARPLTQDPAVVAPAVMQVQMFVELLRVQEKHVARFDERIAELFAAHPAAVFFRQLPGAGASLAPRLLVAFGDDLSRYPTPSSLQKYAGVAPVLERSGQKSWTHWRWHAPIFLRQSLVEWAGQTVAFCPWAKAFYWQHRNAGKGHQGILRALAFKWIRILWRCWQAHEPYDDARYVAALRRRNSPLIALIEAENAAA